MKALLAVFALVLAAVFIVRQPDAESSGTAGRGTGIDDGGPLGSRCTVFADVPTMRDGQLIGPGRFRCAKSNGGVDVTGLSDHLETVVFENPHHALPQEDGIIGNHYPHRISVRFRRMGSRLPRSCRGRRDWPG